MEKLKSLLYVRFATCERRLARPSVARIHRECTTETTTRALAHPTQPLPTGGDRSRNSTTRLACTCFTPPFPLLTTDIRIKTGSTPFMALRIWHFLRLERKARTTKDFTFSRIRLQIDELSPGVKWIAQFVDSTQ